MSQPGRQMRLNHFPFPGGHHEAGWRYPGAQPERILDIHFHVAIAKRAEAAKFDAVFMADGLSLANDIKYVTRTRIEPFTWLSALAVSTERIGLIGTASTTYTAPYNLARLFASLDHLSKGRVGWNIVTTGFADAAQNFGFDEHPVHAVRYGRAHEFMDVVTKLWDSWEDEALVVDAAAGIYADPTKIHTIDHAGHFNVKGPLNTPRSPQGRPVYVQAGSSEHGREFASHYAEAIFCAHSTLANAQAYYSDVKRRVARLGRSPDLVKILPGVCPFIASTQSEAKRLQQELNELTQVEYSIAELKRRTGIDLTHTNLDGPFPLELIAPDGEREAWGRFQVLIDIIKRDNPSIRQLMHKMAGARGHFVSVGTPDHVADELQTWFENGAADGFNVMPPYYLGAFDAFIDEVTPILQKRGLFRTEYEGSTLREHYGLPRPASQFSKAAKAAHLAKA